MWMILVALMPAPMQREAQAAPIDYVEPNDAPVDDAALLRLVRSKFDPMSDPTRWPRAVGVHNGAPVTVYYTCSDVCPQYMKRVVRYNVLPGPACDRAGGVVKEISVPRGIGVGRARFCVPAVTAPYQE